MKMGDWEQHFDSALAGFGFAAALYRKAFVGDYYPDVLAGLGHTVVKKTEVSIEMSLPCSPHGDEFAGIDGYVGGELARQVGPKIEAAFLTTLGQVRNRVVMSTDQVEEDDLISMLKSGEPQSRVLAHPYTMAVLESRATDDTVWRRYEGKLVMPISGPAIPLGCLANVPGHGLGQRCDVAMAYGPVSDYMSARTELAVVNDRFMGRARVRFDMEFGVGIDPDKWSLLIVPDQQGTR